MSRDKHSVCGSSLESLEEQRVWGSRIRPDYDRLARSLVRELA